MKPSKAPSWGMEIGRLEDPLREWKKNLNPEDYSRNP